MLNLARPILRKKFELLAHRARRPAPRCWSTGQDYYVALEKVLLKAKKSILIVGWDFDGRIKLCPARDVRAARRLFARAGGARPQLNPYSGLERCCDSRAGRAAAAAPRRAVAGPPSHPGAARQPASDLGAHHQKIVCIDDTLAFAGGMDLTIRRWDTADTGEE